MILRGFCPLLPRGRYREPALRVSMVTDIEGFVTVVAVSAPPSPLRSLS